MRAPLVSIILPTFNSAPTLAQTLATVLAQDYQAWELIVVDDASADASSAIARSFAAQHPAQIQVIVHPENCGPGPARNAALAAAAGTYVASLDADDLWEPAKLRCQVAALEAHPTAALVWGPGWYADEHGALTALQPTPLAPATALLPVPELARLMLGGLFPFTSSVMARREAALAVGGYETLRRGQDMSLLFKLAAAHPTLYDPEPRCRYRIHAGSSTSRSERQGIIAQRDEAYLRWLAAFLRTAPAAAHLAPLADALLAQQVRLASAERAQVHQRGTEHSEE